MFLLVWLSSSLLKNHALFPINNRSTDHSMVELSRWAVHVLQDYRQGQIKAEYSLEEFEREVKKIPRETDFSKMAKDMAKSKRSVQVETTSNASAKKNKKITIQTTLFPSSGKLKADSVSKPKDTGSSQFSGWTVAKLQKQCVEWGLPKTGKKADLIVRLSGPRPPKLLLERKAKGCYVPSRYNTCATALLVGLWLEQRTAGPDWKGMTKEELYPLAESLDISKDPFSGVATGPFKYDGWSSMSDLRSGEIPLVVLKRGHFKLTTSSEIGGFHLAEALHSWCHEHGICSCQQFGYS
mmetsp:Transcript_12685/g.19500  ORF Transcript_12685/g.19500 Transcript_12685/m.19500 type:complete len:296 (-) Transcript_12685:93-980(-)